MSVSPHSGNRGKHRGVGVGYSVHRCEYCQSLVRAESTQRTNMSSMSPRCGLGCRRVHAAVRENSTARGPVARHQAPDGQCRGERAASVGSTMGHEEVLTPLDPQSSAMALRSPSTADRPWKEYSPRRICHCTGCTGSTGSAHRVLVGPWCPSGLGAHTPLQTLEPGPPRDPVTGKSRSRRPVVPRAQSSVASRRSAGNGH